MSSYNISTKKEMSKIYAVCILHAHFWKSNFHRLNIDCQCTIKHI